jgi:hypothetical protein
LEALELVFWQLCCTYDPADIQSLAITARMAAIVGAQTLDRLFADVEFSEVDNYILYVYAKDEDCACEMEDSFGFHISIIVEDAWPSNRLRHGFAETPKQMVQ